MDFTYFLPRDKHAEFAWLGKQDWLDIRSSGPNATSFDVKEPFRRIQHLARVTRDGSGSGLSLIWIDAISTCLATGPKLYRPTEEQFDAMRHVEVHVPIAEYRQPYPALVVQIPRGSLRTLAAECSLPEETCPELVLVRNRLTSEGANAIFIGHPFSLRPGGQFDNTHYFQDRSAFDDLEQALCTVVAKEGDDLRFHRFSNESGRAIVNLMLMLVHYGSKLGPPLHPEQYETHRRKKDLERFRHADFRTVDVAQEVVVRQVETRKREPSEPTGREMPPHWRAGHWRRQHHGKGNEQVRLVFIRPVFVRMDRAIGDVSETSAEYVVK